MMDSEEWKPKYSLGQTSAIDSSNCFLVEKIVVVVVVVLISRILLIFAGVISTITLPWVRPQFDNTECIRILQNRDLIRLDLSEYF